MPRSMQSAWVVVTGCGGANEDEQLSLGQGAVDGEMVVRYGLRTLANLGFGSAVTGVFSVRSERQRVGQIEEDA
jgi:hypothetical protein